MNFKRYFNKQIVWTLSGAIILMFAAFYNGFPLVTSDSGTYIYSGFKQYVPSDRPFVYGFFIRHSSLKSSFWFTILAQGIIMSFLLWQVLNRFTGKRSGMVGKFILFILVAAFSSVSWVTSELMPDMFSAAGILAFLLLLQRDSGKANTLFNALILVLACLVHNSHLLLFSILSLVLPAYLLFSQTFRRQLTTVWRCMLVLLLVASSWILAPAINYSLDGNFRLTGAPYVFLVAKQAENGIIDRYLDDNCPHFVKRVLPDSGTYLIAGKDSKNVMDTGLPADSAVTLTRYLAQPAQQFRIVRVSGAFYKIVSQGGKCLQMDDCDSCGVHRLLQRDFTGSDLQLFRFHNAAADSGDLTIINKYHDRPLNLQDDSLADDCEQEFRIITFPHCLCLYKDQVPGSAIAFLWNDNSILDRTGAWENSTPEYKSTLHGIWFSPAYFINNAGQALVATAMQLTRNDIGDGIGAYDEKSPPYRAIQQTLPYELKPFSNSRENRSQLNFTEINKRNFWLLLLSVCTLLLFSGNAALRSTVPAELAVFIKLCMAALVVNAFVTGALANVLDRLQTRVSWLLPLLALILLFNMLEPQIRKKLAALAEKAARP